MNTTTPAIKGTMGDLQTGAPKTPPHKDDGINHDKRIATLDDKMAGSMLANEIIAAGKLESNVWRTFAWRIMRLSIEARTAFLNAIKAEKGAMTKGQVEFGIDDKTAKKRTNSFNTRTSEMAAFAHAWNTGASITGMMAYANEGLPKAKQCASEDELVAFIGYTTMLEYARTFKKSKAGRPSKTWTEKLVKFLEDNTPDEDNATEQALHVAIVKMVNTTSRSASTTPF